MSGVPHPESSSRTFEVIVHLKSEVLDPEGRAIRESLQRLGRQDLVDVKVGKRFVLTLGEAEKGGSQLIDKAKEIAEAYLANPVSETFQIREI